ncbi:MAG: glycosyltransferase family 4 protein [Chitinispirillaceae bacterium]|nr:glycosyltransferase family 4 protein [Chitinispirillaceae bacterium]
MRIVALGLRGFPNIQGGIENHCENLYPRLVRYGCEVIVLSRSPYTGKKPYEYKGVKIYPLWSPRHKSLETLLHTVLAVICAGKYKPDLIHFHAVGPAAFVPFIKARGIKVAVTHHGFDYERAKWGRVARGFLRFGERQMCTADGIIAVSDHIREYLEKKYGVAVSTIPNGVSLPEITGPGPYCRKWNVEQGRYFLFTGRLVPEKCVHELLEAFRAVQTDWKLVIAGNADHDDTYSKELRKQASTTEKVIMTGFITGKELREIFSNAGCFVLPSSHEGLPIALLEALGFGLPCIVSDIPPNRCIKHSSVSYFPVHGVLTLKNLLQQACRTPVSNDKNSGRAYVSSAFNWDSIAEKTYDYFKHITQ